jgi:lipopolysaccharide biosynthesis regulator YciM
VAERDIELLPEILDDMHDCHVELGTQAAFIDYLHDAITRYAGISPVLALADILSGAEGSESAARFIAGELGKRPSVRGLSRFIDLSLSRSEGEAHDNLTILKNMTDQLLANKPVYQCRNCGFYGRALHWQCPGCKHWNTIKPIHGVEGD